MGAGVVGPEVQEEFFHSDPLHEADDADQHSEPSVAPIDPGKLRPQDNQQCAGQHRLNDVAGGKETGPGSAHPGEKKKRDHWNHVGEIIGDPAARAVLVVG